ncbi:MAG: hypothetical protein H8E68_02160 [Kiritimatiellaeota bacterium]|nr:hypothetical protein [Kiritimatiellota bacterium]
MKILQTSLALMALFALVMPCAHAEEHHHEIPGAEFCAMDHVECHSCSDEPCTDSPEVALIVSAAEIPAPRIQILYDLHVEHHFLPVIVPLCGALSHLQTVRLLI